MAIPAIAAALSRGLVADVLGSVAGLQLSIDVRLDAEGLKQLKGKRRTAVYRAVNRAAKPVKEAVIANASKLKRTGALAKAIGTKTRIYAGGVVTVIGPKMSFKRRTKTKKKGPNKGTRSNIRPYLYANLLEKGTIRAAAKPFLEPAWDAHGPGYMRRVRAEIAAELAAVMQSGG
jgi:hypothetical protein